MRAAVAIAASLVALLAACGDDEEPEASSSASITITGFRFQPPRVEVPLGTTVMWTNEDGFAHTVTAEDESFDSPELAEGVTFEQRFEQPGAYAYFCAIHNYMTGAIVVD